MAPNSEEKREPVSDIDTAAVDSLKVLDPKRPIREVTQLGFRRPSFVMPPTQRPRGDVGHGAQDEPGQGCPRVPSGPHTIFICCLSSLAKMFFGMRPWTPRTMSTTWVTRKLTAMLQSA